MSYETPPPYGDDREDLPPLPPELEAPAEPLPPNDAKKTFRKYFWTSFFVHVLTYFVVIGFLAAPISVLVGLIGMGAASNPIARAKMSGLAAGAALSLVAAAGICTILVTSASNSGI